MRKFIEEVSAEGHLIDSGILSKIFDTIITNNGEFEVTDFRIGKTNVEPSAAKILVKARKRAELDTILAKLHQLGCIARNERLCLKPAPKDGVAPEDFYSTTNHRTYVRIKENWVLVEDIRMDSVIVVKGNKAVCTLLRDLKEGDLVVCGVSGVKVVPESKERSRGEFAFMEQEVSSERSVEAEVKHLAHLMKELKRRKSKIVAVVGPVVAHTGGVDALSSIIRSGYINVLLSGNALAVHDIEYSVLGTSLGVDLATGQPQDNGHRNHMFVINLIRKIGSIKGAVERKVLKSGIMYECVRNNVPFVLAGSLRDDGPLPETEMDLIKAQNAYRKALRNAELVLILGTMLHGIATGNMLPSYVRTFCVDINPAVVTKLNDRGTSQAVGIVTDVGLFLRLLAKELV